MKFERIVYPSVAIATALTAAPTCDNKVNSYKEATEYAVNLCKEKKLDGSIFENKNAQEIIKKFFENPNDFQSYFFYLEDFEKEGLITALKNKSAGTDFLDNLEKLEKKGFIFTEQNLKQMLSEKFSSKSIDGVLFGIENKLEVSNTFILSTMYSEEFQERIEDTKKSPKKLQKLKKIVESGYSTLPLSTIFLSGILEEENEYLFDFLCNLSKNYPQINSLRDNDLDSFWWSNTVANKKNTQEINEAAKFITENFSTIKPLLDTEKMTMYELMDLYKNNPNSASNILATTGVRGAVEIGTYFSDPSLEVISNIDRMVIKELIGSTDEESVSEWANRIGRSLFFQNLPVNNENITGTYNKINEIRGNKEITEKPTIKDRSFLLLAHNESEKRFGPKEVIEKIKALNPKSLEIFKAEDEIQKIEKLKQSFLKELGNVKKPTAFFDAHGSPNGVFFSNKYDCHVSPEEIANALIHNQIYNKYNEQAILIFSSCNGHTFLRKVLDIIKDYNLKNKNQIALPILFGESEYGQLALTNSWNTAGYDDLWDQFLTENPTVGSLIAMSDKNSNSHHENYTLYIPNKSKENNKEDMYQIADTKEVEVNLIDEVIRKMIDSGIKEESIDREFIAKTLPKDPESIKKHFLDETYWPKIDDSKNS